MKPDHKAQTSLGSASPSNPPIIGGEPSKGHTLPTSSTKNNIHFCIYEKFDNNNEYFSTHIFFYFLTSMFQKDWKFQSEIHKMELCKQ